MSSRNSAERVRLPATREAFVQLATHAGRGPAHRDAANENATDAPASPRPRATPIAISPGEAENVIAFWRAAGPALWFAKDPEFDRRFRECFLSLHEAAARGTINAGTTPDGALALVLLLDQFPRNAFRGTARMYATDVLARLTAETALEAGHDQAIEPELRLFFCLPFAHSEDLADQARAVALARGLGEPHLSHALRHRDIVLRFGRFPHRNPILGRAMTPVEQRFLDEGGYAG
jgi:uncharacterized protein (DUF924 family)